MGDDADGWRGWLRRATCVAALLAALGGMFPLTRPAPLQAQLGLPRAHLDWRTLRTEHFDIHYPEPAAEWTLDVAARLDAVYVRVAALVGSAPRERVTVVVDDPSNLSNGSAWPVLDRPAIYLWPTPPEPRASIGNFRDWGELLATHELAHVAHLTRPSRNPRQRLLWNLSPLPLGPVVRKAPRWVTEGYATYVEGRLTGSGRPAGSFRPAVLREWALEGKLPRYDQLSGTGGFLQGSYAYLVGSAYLEWLTERRGDSSLVHLWRRMSARQDRSFEEAFAGVFGGLPADLYGRFTVELTEQALRASEQLAAAPAGIVVGDTVQALTWFTGDPAVSPDGKQLAVPLGARDEPTRIVIWKAADELEDSVAVRRRREALERDPEDVPAVQWRPRPKRALATLHAVAGRGYSAPRFLPDSKELLVIRSVPLADGAERPDLFVWNWTTGEVRRVTHGAAIRDADPSPDGRTAVATRCLYGLCDLVRVDLATGALHVLAPGSPSRAFYRPRWSPDSGQIVAAVQDGGFWRLVLVDAATGAQRLIGPADAASRYDAAWRADSGLVYVSELGGVPNLVILRPDGRETPLTRVTGAAVGPAVNWASGEVYFLMLQPKGYDLHRIQPDHVNLIGMVLLDPALAPVVPPPVAPPVDTLPRVVLPPSRPYGLGPRGWRWLPGAAWYGDQVSGTLALVNGDPVGRLTALAQGAFGSEGSWRGASLGVTYRGLRPALGGDLFWVGHEPSAQDGGFAEGLDAEYRGATLAAALNRSAPLGPQRLRAGLSWGELDRDLADAGTRRLAFAEAGASALRTRGAFSVRLAGSASASVGSTDGADWQRGIGTASVFAGTDASNLELRATYGRVGGDAPIWERFAVGGIEPTLFDAGILSQRIPMPALPVGVVRGDELWIGRAMLGLAGTRPFFWAARVGRDNWYRVLGLETSFDLPGVGLLGLPGIRIITGQVYPLDEPFKDELRFYLSVGYRP